MVRDRMYLFYDGEWTNVVCVEHSTTRNAFRSVVVMLVSKGDEHLPKPVHCIRPTSSTTGTSVMLAFHGNIGG